MVSFIGDEVRSEAPARSKASDARSPPVEGRCVAGVAASRFAAGGCRGCSCRGRLAFGPARATLAAGSLSALVSR
jgi:hypothetical protein